MCYMEYIPPEEAERRARKFDFQVTRIQDYAKVTVPLPPEGEFCQLLWQQTLKDIHQEHHRKYYDAPELRIVRNETD